MWVRSEIERRLRAALAPQRLEVIDESARHTGHAGARPEGETHFRILVVSSAFAGLGRLERQRRVHALLADLLRERVHALAIVARAPGEPLP
ncbi:MAG: BolA family transcriptional regulator [Geminicoccaceae bacterium]|nr:BolA family transcriptional regulator [Geminicoccaceae bacterium]MCS7267851.1 BolA family transcriptional regulator [Geminicoccaceae bacterium]MCX7630012.1 BolA family transcriptional regulator [Geminicoccaceae bacterium]MDW8124526.1 BolA family protein [Geminicoccaceae bacterium]MDW8341346.1 BolA family protein [Geminicoccaceae bacterium]